VARIGEITAPHLIRLAILGCPAVLRAASVDSHISAATVYADRAVITRTAEVDLQPGENVLVFDHLPASLVEQSLQFAGHGTASATILDVNAQTTFVDTSPSIRVKELEDQISDLSKQSRALEDRMAILDDERDYVKRMLASATIGKSSTFTLRTLSGKSPRNSGRSTISTTTWLERKGPSTCNLRRCATSRERVSRR